MWSIAILICLVNAVFIESSPVCSEYAAPSCSLEWIFEEHCPLIMLRETKTIVPPINDGNISSNPMRIPMGKKLIFACPGEDNRFKHDKFAKEVHTKLHGECVDRDKFQVCLDNKPEIVELRDLFCTTIWQPSIKKQEYNTQICEEKGQESYKLGYTYGENHEFKDLLEVEMCFYEENKESLCTSPNLQEYTGKDMRSGGNMTARMNHNGACGLGPQGMGGGGAGPSGGATSRSVKCGKETRSTQTRIINGEEVEGANQFPWQVAIYNLGTHAQLKEMWCGGSIITTKHILTAAHCFDRWDEFKFGLGFGSHKHLKHRIWYDIDFHEMVTIHPDYSRYGNADSSDIAIIKLPKKINFKKDNINPICLIENEEEKLGGTLGTIIGWGRTVGFQQEHQAITPERLPDVLRMGVVHIMYNSACIERVSTIPDIHWLKVSDYRVICGVQLYPFDEEGFDGQKGQNFCSGDSGGPLMVREEEDEAPGITEDGPWVQVGINAYSHGCAFRNYPHVFTKVPEFMEWIKITVGRRDIYTVPYKNHNNPHRLD